MNYHTTIQSPTPDTSYPPQESVCLLKMDDVYTPPFRFKLQPARTRSQKRVARLGLMFCPDCGAEAEFLIKNGKNINHKQRFYCKSCSHQFIKSLRCFISVKKYEQLIEEIADDNRSLKVSALEVFILRHLIKNSLSERMVMEYIEYNLGGTIGCENDLKELIVHLLHWSRLQNIDPRMFS